MRIRTVTFFNNRPEGSESFIGYVGENEEIRCILREIAMNNIETI